MEKANSISNLKYLAEQIDNLHLDEKFEGHNDEILTDITYIIACQIIEANEHIHGLSKDDIEIVKEANMEVRRQNGNTLPFVNKVYPIPNDVVCVKVGDIADDYIRKTIGKEANTDEPIEVRVEAVDYDKKTVKLKGGAIVKINNVEIIEAS